ncbi:MAG: FAD-binding oxidoreductase [Acetobacteraceae bacterium]|nr:FAD-binding oxidoreductase [Acetobacteraceae bacterium]MDW8398109.1 FAD-binding oxidoreductase [Acetobacteraceae bacterium]
MDTPRSPAARSAAFLAELGDIPRAEDPALLRQKSRDFHWFSPVLKQALEGARADLLLLPRSAEELERIASACARHRVPLTLRGGGTGNYGQCVPLSGGVVVETAGLERILSLRPGAVRAEAGIRLQAINDAARPQGWELRLYPSTVRSSSLGGFLAGGAGGVGSCMWGILAQPGNVLSATVLTVEETPRRIELAGPELRLLLHGYGTTGILLEAEVPLAAAHQWIECVFAFPRFAEAARFGRTLVEQNGIVKREVASIAWPGATHFRPIAEVVPEGAALVLASLADISVPAARALLAETGGEECLALDAAACAARGMPPVYEFGWNHATLSALRARGGRGVTYLQVGLPPGGEIAMIEAIMAALPGEVVPQCEWVRLGATVTCFGLHLVMTDSIPRLREIEAVYRSLGATLKDAHAWDVEHGDPQPVHAEMAAFRRRVDPFGLLNPGKLLSAG